MGIKRAPWITAIQVGMTAVMLTGTATFARDPGSFNAGPGELMQGRGESGQTSVHYSIALFSPDQHLLHVRMQLPPGPAVRELQLPVWNALYQIRDFSQFINWIRAATPSGAPLSLEQINKGRWRLPAAETGAVIDYEVYANDAGPFGAQLNSRHCFLNLAEVLLYSDDLRQRSIDLDISALPEGWRLASTLPSGVALPLHADNYDQLVDAPIEMGKFEESDFDESGGHYRVIVDADHSTYDMTKLTSMVRNIVAAETSWMQDRPFQTYTFIYHFPNGAGSGMEHAYGTAIDTSAESMARGYESVASVTAHEFFHLWNVKRIRPEALEPADYTRENYTRALWFSEGVTSTVEWIGQLRAGLIDETEFRRELASSIGELQRRSAHRTQSVEESSLDAWLEGDRYYWRPERSISYYNKGALLGLLLDLAVRESTHGRKSLREVFQWMNENYARKSVGFSESEGVRKAAEAVSGGDLRDFFAKYVAGTDEIPWNDFFRTVGLRLDELKKTVPDAGFSAGRDFDGPMVVTSVTPGGAADQAGLREGDQILAINGQNSEANPALAIAGTKVGDDVVVRLHTGSGGSRELKWKIGSREEMSYVLNDAQNPTPAQLARRAAWLKGEAEAGETLQ